MLRDDYLQDGRDGKTTWVERTMSITTPDPQAGSDLQLAETLNHKEMNGKQLPMSNVKGTMPEHFQKTELEQVLPVFDRSHLQQQAIRLILYLCLPQERRLQVPESYHHCGSRDIHQRAVLTLLTIILEQLRGLILAVNNTSACMVARIRTILFNNSLFLNSGLFQVDGKCDLPILQEYTLSIITPRQQLGTILDYHPPWIRTCRNTNVISDASSSTSDRSLLFVSCLANAISKFDVLIFSRIRTLRSCDNQLRILRNDL
jgi:hypothetical protein